MTIPFNQKSNRTILAYPSNGQWKNYLLSLSPANCMLTESRSWTVQCHQRVGWWRGHPRLHVSHLGIHPSRAHRKHGCVGETAFRSARLHSVLTSRVARVYPLLLTGILRPPATPTCCCFNRLRVLVSAPELGNVTLVYELYKSRRLGHLFQWMIALQPTGNPSLIISMPGVISSRAGGSQRQLVIASSQEHLAKVR